MDVFSTGWKPVPHLEARGHYACRHYLFSIFDFQLTFVNRKLAIYLVQFSIGNLAFAIL